MPYERILHAPSEPQSWLTYGGSYSSQQFSSLKQINRTNIANLKVAWIYQPSKPVSNLEASPIVADGVMYLTEPPSTVTALDVRTGLRLWSWSPTLPEHVVSIGLYATSRGVAILGDTVFIGTADSHLVALDAKTGAVRWNVHVADNAMGYAMTGPPLALNGKVIIGSAGSEAAVRGFLDAYDAKTGKKLWRFWTTPRPGEPGAETWGNGAFQSAGATTWNNGSYDPELNLIYWGTGNPAPDFNDDERPGDNLYTCSVIALDADTGKLKWYFQFSPHEDHDWDSDEPPVLFNAPIDGKPRKLLGFANRNGFYYVLDRTNGKFITGRPFVKQTWAKGLDANGRPIPAPNQEPTSGRGNAGLSEHYRGRGLDFALVFAGHGTFLRERARNGRVLHQGDGEDRGRGRRRESWAEAESERSPASSRTVRFARLRPRRGSCDGNSGCWRRRGCRCFRPPADWYSAASEEGNFFALDAVSGKPLWQFYMGHAARSNPVSYEVDGKQYIFVTAGNVYLAFALP